MSDLLDLAVLERKKYNHLNEVLELTGQLGEALDRNDEVSVRMLVAMRQEPLMQLEEVAETAKARKAGLEQEARERLEALLAGAEARGKDEQTYLEQARKSRTLLERVVELDRRISIRMAGDDSFYKKQQKESH